MLSSKCNLYRYGEVERHIWWKLALEFVQPMPLMSWMAIAIESLEAYLHDNLDSWIDVGVLLVLQLLNVLVGFIEVGGV